MDTPSIAKRIVDGLHAKHGNGSSGSSDNPNHKGIRTGHIAAMERFSEAHRDGKPTEMAAALRDFLDLHEAEKGAEED